MYKKIFTAADLYDFLKKQNKSVNFSSKKDGYEITISTPGSFELVEDNDSEGLLYCSLKAFHDLSNENKSYIDSDVFEKRITTMVDRPIMADIVDVEKNGETVKDFSGHTMHIDEEQDKIIYDEIPIGHVVNPENIHTEYDSDYDRTFAHADCVIYEEYTDACDILRRRQKVDCSVELTIRSMSFNPKQQELHLDDYYVQGITLLGEAYLPGMKGSNVTLKDFSSENNSVYFNRDELVKEITQAVIKQLGDNKTATFADNSTRKEEPKTVFEKLLKKYNKTEADITFEYEGLSDEELEALFEEHFASKKRKKGSGDDDSAVVSDGEGDSSGENQGQDDNNTGETNTNTGDNTGDTNTDDNNGGENTNENQNENNSTENQNDNPDNNTENPEDNTENPEDNGEDNNGGDNSEVYSKTFELSHDDIRSALYVLIQPFEDSDDDWYWINEVFDDYFIYQGCVPEHIFKQSYKKDDDNVSLEGERVHMNIEYLTDSELVALNEMRSNYSQIQSKLASYEAEPEKMAILKSDCYSQISETEAFKDLIKQETHFEMSVEDVQAKADAMLLEFAKTNKIEFSSKKESEPAKKVGMKMLPVNKKSGGRSRYGGLFAKSE